MTTHRTKHKTPPEPKSATVRCKPRWEWQCPYCGEVAERWRQPTNQDQCGYCQRDVWLKEA